MPGDWAVRRPDLAPGGWAFEFDNDDYPDTDDTAEVVLALRRAAAGHPDPAAVRGAIDRGVAWTAGMQSRDGGWGAFDADNTRRLADEAAVLRLRRGHRPAVRRRHRARGGDARRRRARHVRRRPPRRRLAARRQEPDGSWFGRWGANHVYGTGAVVPALVAAGVRTDYAADPPRRRLAGGAPERRRRLGRGPALLPRPRVGRPRRRRPPSQTAWALLALLAAGERGPAVERGVAYLVDTQRPDGGWDEAYFTGTGFPGDFYINYHLYRLVFPVSALGRYVAGSS